jgi:hypothetical protein
LKGEIKMKLVGKRSKYKIHIIDEMGNVTECRYYESELECDNAIFDLPDTQLYKAYIGIHLYSWHSKLA